MKDLDTADNILTVRGGKNILFSVNPIKKYKIFCHIQEILREGFEYTFAEIISFILILTLSLQQCQYLAPILSN